MAAGQPEPVVYDVGALIAADHSERRTWADHRLRLEAGVVPIVPAPTVVRLSSIGVHADGGLASQLEHR